MGRNKGRATKNDTKNQKREGRNLAVALRQGSSALAALKSYSDDLETNIKAALKFSSGDSGTFAALVHALLLVARDDETITPAKKAKLLRLVITKMINSGCASPELENKKCFDVYFGGAPRLAIHHACVAREYLQLAPYLTEVFIDANYFTRKDVWVAAIETLISLAESSSVQKLWLRLHPDLLPGDSEKDYHEATELLNRLLIG